MGQTLMSISSNHDAVLKEENFTFILINSNNKQADSKHVKFGRNNAIYSEMSHVNKRRNFTRRRI